MTTFSHARLRELIATPLLMGEKVRTIEERMGFILQGATDFVRADVRLHGLTGSLKLAHAAETVGMDIEPHTAGPEMLHFMAAVKNANYYEVVWVHPNVPDFNAAHLPERELHPAGLHRRRGHGRGPRRPRPGRRVRLGLYRASIRRARSNALSSRIGPFLLSIAHTHKDSDTQHAFRLADWPS